jgi:hypothetical protein
MYTCVESWTTSALGQEVGVGVDRGRSWAEVGRYSALIGGVGVADGRDIVSAGRGAQRRVSECRIH